MKRESCCGSYDCATFGLDANDNRKPEDESLGLATGSSEYRRSIVEEAMTKGQISRRLDKVIGALEYLQNEFDCCPSKLDERDRQRIQDNLRGGKSRLIDALRFLEAA